MINRLRYWRAARLGGLDLCRRVTFEGMESLHAARDAGDVSLALRPPGEAFIRRVLEVFELAGDGIRIVENEASVLEVSVRPAPKGRFVVRFQ